MTVASRHFTGPLLVILLLAALLRGLFPTADPPTNPTAGIVWHDEGAWVHNARNKALFGDWSLDNWNPMYIAPVFTGLEYLSFEAFGVGVRQARLVPGLLGVLSVALLALGVRRIAGREAGLIAGTLLAANFAYVMWNRAALMEGPMVAFLVASWYCYVRAQDDARWGWPAGGLALLAFFTKASAAFYAAALGADALLVLTLHYAGRETAPGHRRAAVMTLGGLVASSILALAVFVLPNWTEYRFYNWQMSVTRKPSYGFQALVDRVSWFPVLHDLFTRMWFSVTVGIVAALGLLGRWRTAAAGERLLVLWIGLGTLELVLHDVGNERRFVLFIPPLIALTAVVLGRDRTLLPPALARISRPRALVAAPLVLYGLYIVFGSIVRVAFLYEISPNVRLAAALAVLATAGLYLAWPRVTGFLSGAKLTARTAMALTAALTAGQLVQYVQWTARRTYENYEASRAVGRALPPGTLVHGKLANGLSLENRIKPVFVGRGFGNYEDRKVRDDVRYILTYIAPSVGYESQRANPVIQDVLDAYPNRTIIMTFDVAETATGHDRAALIDKFGREKD
ncbi:MAG: glycosyltransferase family 39 protein [Vicinamibacterales bacterium]